jgi:single-strand DNA-binding protein
MANFDFNKSMLGGRLTADPELKQTASGISACTFKIAVNRNYTEQDGTRKADFINCVAWRKTAEFVCNYFKKGSSIFVVGEIQTRNWEDENGQKRYATEVKIDEARFVDSKNDVDAAAQPTQFAPNPTQWGKGQMPSAYSGSSDNFEEIPGDESLPF